MTMRGVKKPGTITTTYVVRGEFEDNAELRNTFFNLVRR
jgi:GTP cyclohydrolase I